MATACGRTGQCVERMGVPFAPPFFRLGAFAGWLLMFVGQVGAAGVMLESVVAMTYASSGFIDRTGHFPGAPRSVFVELTRRW